MGKRVRHAGVFTRLRVVKTGMDDSIGTSIVPTRPKERYRSREEKEEISKRTRPAGFAREPDTT
jgi:hypothetical protein